MVYLQPKHKMLLFADNTQGHFVHMQIYITAFLLMSARPLPPLAPSIPLSPSFVFPVTYLEIPLLLLVVRISIHSRPWLAINCSPLAT